MPSIIKGDVLKLIRSLSLFGKNSKGPPLTRWRRIIYESNEDDRRKILFIYLYFYSFGERFNRIYIHVKPSLQTIIEIEISE